MGLDDLFEVRATPVHRSEEGQADLGEEASRRLAQLFDRQARGTLSAAEQRELERLVAEYGRRMHERRIRELAEQRGIPVEQARGEAAAQLDEALAWWRAFDLQRRRLVMSRAGRRRARAVE